MDKWGGTWFQRRGRVTAPRSWNLDPTAGFLVCSRQEYETLGRTADVFSETLCKQTLIGRSQLVVGQHRRHDPRPVAAPAERLLQSVSSDSDKEAYATGWAGAGNA